MKIPPRQRPFVRAGAGRQGMRTGSGTAVPWRDHPDACHLAYGGQLGGSGVVGGEIAVLAERAEALADDGAGHRAEWLGAGNTKLTTPLLRPCISAGT